MENILEKVFINRHLGIKLKSYIDENAGFGFKPKKWQLFLDTKILIKLLENM